MDVEPETRWSAAHARRRQERAPHQTTAPLTTSMSRSSSEKCNTCSRCTQLLIDMKCNQTVGCFLSGVVGAAVGSTCGLGAPAACLCGICGAVIGGDADGESCWQGGGRNRKTKRKDKKRKESKTHKRKRKKTRQKKRKNKKEKDKKKGMVKNPLSKRTRSKRTRSKRRGKSRKTRR